MIPRLILISALACAAAAWAVDPADPPFPIHPTSLSLSRQFSFDADGQPTSISQELQVSFVVLPVGKIVPVFLEPPQITDIVTDTGERLVAIRRQQPQEDAGSSCNRDESLGTTATIDITPPDAPAKSLTMTGTIEILYASGESDTARLQPLEKFIGKRVRLGEKPGISVSVRLEDNQLSLFLDRDADHLLRRVVFASANHEVTQVNDNGCEAVDDHTHRHAFNGQFSGAGSLLLEFHHELKRAKVPFAFKNLVLSAPQPQNQETSEHVDLIHGASASELAVQVLEDPPSP